eukprot:1685193-Rhodomonas_salina.1
MFEDNMACIFMSRSSASFHKVRVRHIDTRVYHLRELCKTGVMKLRLEKVESAKMARPLFEYHRNIMPVPSDGAPADGRPGCPIISVRFKERGKRLLRWTR